MAAWRSVAPDPGGAFGGKQHAKFEPLVAFMASGPVVALIVVYVAILGAKIARAQRRRASNLELSIAADRRATIRSTSLRESARSPSVTPATGKYALTDSRRS